jgi:hypothetical protein
VLSQIASFGRMVGQSFEAQSLIAMVNTLLTTTGRPAFFRLTFLSSEQCDALFV